jgi:ankyrin repeat protein
MESSAKGDIGTVKLLMSGAADVNARDNYGSTALMTASSNNDLEMVRLLLSEGADVNAENRHGITALWLTENEEMKQLLKKYGANLIQPQPPLNSIKNN